MFERLKYWISVGRKCDGCCLGCAYFEECRNDYIGELLDDMGTDFGKKGFEREGYEREAYERDISLDALIKNRKNKHQSKNQNHQNIDQNSKNKIQNAQDKDKNNRKSA
ncbi:MAG: hypothetical protein K6E10_00425 [Eubacterium sp.]|nr:hypothetical protein [Eubacterium sp.]